MTLSSGVISPSLRSSVAEAAGLSSRRKIVFSSGLRALFCSFCFYSAAQWAVGAEGAVNLGIFAGQTDIGAPKQPGTVNYHVGTGSYTVGGSGANMWFKTDSFHYVWKKIEGDVALTADITFIGQSTEPHRKACLMFRQTLEADSVYADAAFHGDGLTSLQFRAVAGDVTREVQTNTSAPRRLRLDKIGDTIYLSLAGADGVLHPTGGSVHLNLKGSFYLGLGVCAHQADVFESAVFSNVQITPPNQEVTAVRSSLEYIAVASKDRRSVHHSTEVIEAPNWTRDGTALIFNGRGRIYRLPLAAGSAPAAIDTGFAVKCNNDHGLSPDGTTLVISDQTKDGSSRLYTLPVTGGTPREVTPNAPSYWHGWSPDGKTLAYCAQREGKFGIFTIPVAGGVEHRLTRTDGLDDGPDYSPDGQWIYFNSDRSGRMQIWRMHPDGSAVEQITKDDYNNWFAHPSPDGKWLVFLSYASDVRGHPPDHDVTLRLMAVATGEITVLVNLFGGQGTLNVPSWSPDSTKVAYVRYQPQT